jgi:hypothetical protein
MRELDQATASSGCAGANDLADKHRTFHCDAKRSRGIPGSSGTWRHSGELLLVLRKGEKTKDQLQMAICETVQICEIVRF